MKKHKKDDDGGLKARLALTFVKEITEKEKIILEMLMHDYELPALRNFFNIGKARPDTLNLTIKTDEEEWSWQELYP